MKTWWVIPGFYGGLYWLLPYTLGGLDAVFGIHVGTVLGTAIGFGVILMRKG